MDSSNQAASYVIGGLLLGIWLWLALFEPDFGTPWGLWGLLGIAIAAAFYAVRMVSEAVRVLLFVAIGICLGLLLTAVLVQQEVMIMAAFLTFAGGGLVAGALPTPGRHDRLGGAPQDDERP